MQSQLPFLLMTEEKGSFRKNMKKLCECEKSIVAFISFVV